MNIQPRKAPSIYPSSGVSPIMSTEEGYEAIAEDRFDVSRGSWLNARSLSRLQIINGVVFGALATIIMLMLAIDPSAYSVRLKLGTSFRTSSNVPMVDALNDVTYTMHRWRINFAFVIALASAAVSAFGRYMWAGPTALNEGRNPMRWVANAISHGALLLGVAVYVGVTDLSLLATLWALIVVWLMCFAWQESILLALGYQANGRSDMQAIGLAVFAFLTTFGIAMVYGISMAVSSIGAPAVATTAMVVLVLYLGYPLIMIVHSAQGVMCTEGLLGYMMAVFSGSGDSAPAKDKVFVMGSLGRPITKEIALEAFDLFFLSASSVLLFGLSSMLL